VRDVAEKRRRKGSSRERTAKGENMKRP